MAPSFLVANLAQALVNVLFGSSSVAAAIGLSDKVDPLSFGLLRVSLACVGMMLMTFCAGERVVARGAGTHLAAASVLLWTSEICYLTGVTLAGSIPASVWQPSQPIFTLLITAALGTERLTLTRVVGIVLAFGGCAVMVLGGASDTGAGKGEHAHALLGHGCFFTNCLATVLYVVWTRSLVGKYPPLTLATNTFLWMTLYYTIVFTSVLLFAPGATAYFCGGAPCRSLAELSSTSWFAVGYVTIFATLAPYVLQLWATTTLPASLISAYYALQPVAAVLLCFVVIAATPVPHYGLRGPQPTDLAAFAVGVGLLLVVRDTSRGQSGANLDRPLVQEQEIRGSVNSCTEN